MHAPHSYQGFSIQRTSGTFLYLGQCHAPCKSLAGPQAKYLCVLSINMKPNAIKKKYLREEIQAVMSYMPFWGARNCKARNISEPPSWHQHLVCCLTFKLPTSFLEAADSFQDPLASVKPALTSLPVSDYMQKAFCPTYVKHLLSYFPVVDVLLPAVLPGKLQVPWLLWPTQSAWRPAQPIRTGVFSTTQAGFSSQPWKSLSQWWLIEVPQEPNLWSTDVMVCVWMFS